MVPSKSSPRGTGSGLLPRAEAQRTRSRCLAVMVELRRRLAGEQDPSVGHARDRYRVEAEPVGEYVGVMFAALRRRTPDGRPGGGEGVGQAGHPALATRNWHRERAVGE